MDLIMPQQETINKMGLQKYRADKAGEKQKNGAIPFFVHWMGGPSLSLIRNCPVENDPSISPRTVYIKGEADTYFSVPAAIKLKGKKMTGYVSSNSEGEYIFRRHMERGNVQ
jgi:hypothetical protein